ncbi:hypothetical protein ETB97_003292 [Aspergillus alliaceus]|uniref:Uncharacterized protein n=1 Tax=Petromyces alliaceus TaxID=209559 RepID=A0A8H5ZZF9_PETAA|nr:hypothetical protein ETB97_003292 [Aspergillus burnettii]
MRSLRSVEIQKALPEPDVEQWAKWLATNIPTGVPRLYAQLEAAFRTSCLVPVTVGIEIWTTLRADDKALNVITPVNSSNTVTFAILRRRRTLLATEEWLAIPWVNDKRPKDILQQLLDIASGVPSFLAELDYIMSMVNENCLSPLEMRTQQEKLNARADKTFRQLDAWKESVASAYPPGSISKSPAPYKDDFPIFQCYNPKTEVEFATHYEYPNVILAHTMCYYWALLLVISEPTPIPLHSLKPCERYTIACNICRSIRYFIYAAPKNLIYRLLFPLLIAHSVFVPGSVEMEFLRDVSNYIERHFRTAIFTSMMGSLSDVDYRELSKLF